MKYQVLEGPGGGHCAPLISEVGVEADLFLPVWVIVFPNFGGVQEGEAWGFGSDSSPREVPWVWCPQKLVAKQPAAGGEQSSLTAEVSGEVEAGVHVAAGG